MELLSYRRCRPGCTPCRRTRSRAVGSSACRRPVPAGPLRSRSETGELGRGFWGCPREGAGGRGEKNDNGAAALNSEKEDTDGSTPVCAASATIVRPVDGSRGGGAAPMHGPRAGEQSGGSNIGRDEWTSAAAPVAEGGETRAATRTPAAPAVKAGAEASRRA